MRSIGIGGCFLFAVACGGDEKANKAEVDVFAAAYVQAVEKIGKLCDKKQELSLQPPSAENQTLEMAIAISMGRAVASYTLPEAPSSMAGCRAEAVAALDALKAALAPVEKAGDPYKGQSAHLVNAAIREEWEKAKEPARQALRALSRSWTTCRDQAQKARGSIPPPMPVPYLSMGC